MSSMMHRSSARQAADLLEPGDGRAACSACAHLGILAAVQQLEELDDELDVADAAVAGLDLDLGRAGRERPLLDPPLQRLDLGDLGGAEVAAIDERRDRVAETSGPGRGRRRPAGT